MTRPIAEALVNGARPEDADIVTIRRTVLLSAGLTALLIGLLVVWLIRSNKPSAALAVLPAARAADVSTIDERIVKASDALVLPTSPPAPRPRPDPALLADNATAPFVPDPPAVQEPSSPAERPAFDRQHNADTLANAGQQVAADARNADLAVKLDAVPAATSTNRISPAGAMVGADSAPVGEYVLQRGTLIPAATYTSIDSTVPGIVTAQVRQDVYDSTHRYLLISKRLAARRRVCERDDERPGTVVRRFRFHQAPERPHGRAWEHARRRSPGRRRPGWQGRLPYGAAFRQCCSVEHPRRCNATRSTAGIWRRSEHYRQHRSGRRTTGFNSEFASAGQYSNQTPTMHTPEGFILNVIVERDIQLSVYEPRSE